MGIIAQVTSASEKESLQAVIRRIYGRDGVRGFWRGNLATVLKIGPSVAVSLTLFDTMRNFLETRRTFGRYSNDGLNHFVSGAFAGMVSLTLTYPLDAIRTRMSVEGAEGSATMRQAFRDIGGARNLFRGIGLALSEVIPQSGLRFYLMSVARDFFSKRLQDDFPYGTIVVASIAAGCLSTVVTYPLALLRRKQQTTNMSARVCFQRVVHRHGYRGLFRGLGINLVQVVPSVGISFGVYEWAKNFIR